MRFPQKFLDLVMSPRMMLAEFAVDEPPESRSRDLQNCRHLLQAEIMAEDKFLKAVGKRIVPIIVYHFRAAFPSKNICPIVLP